MRRFVLPSLTALLAVALVALLVFGVLQTNGGDDTIDEAVARGQRPLAPDASLPLLDGGTQRFADLRGKVVLVSFFAHWCGPCKEEAPLLVRTQRRIASRGATVVGVAWNETTADARGFVRTYGLNYPVVRDVDGAFGNAYAVRGMPETFLLDADGRIVALRRGPIDERWIAQYLDPLLAGRSS
ncbi:MAG: TlpA disulfide reductase family protein [Conexibacter sp.]